MTNSVVRSIGMALFTVGCAAAIPTLATAQTSTKPASLAGTWNMGLIGDHVIPVALVLEQDGAALKGTYIFMGREFAFAGAVDGNTFTLKGTSPLLGRPGQPSQHTGPAPTGAAASNPAQAAAAFDVKKATVVDTTITGSLNDDGAMAGNVDVKIEEDKTGRIKWTAERLRERKVTNEPAVSSANVDMTGAWTMAVVEAQIQMALDMKQVGSKVTGTASSDHLGTMKLDGTLANGTLTFIATGSNAGQDVRLEFSGKLKTDNTFAGDLTSPMGSMTWTLARAKK